MVVQDGNERFTILGGTIIEGGGGAQIRFGRPRLGNDFIQYPNRHRSQQLDLGNVDAEGALELRAESSGCVMIRVSYMDQKQKPRGVPARESRP